MNHKWSRKAFRAHSNRFEMSWRLLVVSCRARRSRQNRLVVESPLIEDVFVCCTRFLRMYFHRVTSRHWPSPLTHQDAARITQGLLLTSLANGNKAAWLADYGAIAIAIMGRRPPGFFWLFAIRELVSNKPCVILAASWWVSGDGLCRDETR